MTARTVTLPVPDLLRMVMDILTVSKPMAQALASTMAPIPYDEVVDAVNGMSGASQDTIQNSRLADKMYTLLRAWGLTPPIPYYARSYEEVFNAMCGAKTREMVLLVLTQAGFVVDDDRSYRYWRPIGESHEGAHEMISLDSHPDCYQLFGFH